MTRPSAALLPAIAALPSHAATTSGFGIDMGVGRHGDNAMRGDPLADIHAVPEVDFAIKDGVVYRSPAP